MTATAHSNPDRNGRLCMGAACALLLLGAVYSGCSSEPGSAINVVIRLPGPSQALSKAELSVDYSRSGAHPAGGHSPACTVLLPSVDASFRDDGDGRLDITLRSAQGFSPPVDLVACRMLASGKVANPARVQAGLRIEVRSATAVGGTDVSEKRLSTLSARARTRSSAVKQPGGGPDPRDSISPIHTPPRLFAAGSHRNEDAHRSIRGNRRDKAASPDSGNAPARILDRMEESRVESPESVTRPQAPGGSGPIPTANPGLPTILSSAPSAAGDPSGASSLGSSSSGTSGDTGAKLDPTTALPTHDYQITVSVLSSSGDLGALQISLDFVGGSGAFVGRGATVSCSSLASGAMVAVNRQGQGVHAGFINLNGIPTPGPVLSCRFKSRENVTTQSFRVQVADASDTESTKLDPPPFIAVSDVSLLQ